MLVRTLTSRIACLSLFSLLLNGCFNPPYNHFKDPDSHLESNVLLLGDATASNLSGSSNLKTLIDELQRNDIQYVQYGDTMVLVVPIDKYFLFNSPKLNDICYKGLRAIVTMAKQFPNSTFYVAAFTDDVGKRSHQKRLSQSQAEAMLTLLWANGIHAKQLKAQGHGNQFSLGDNHSIHGSAYNRRIEIQWVNAPPIPQRPLPTKGGMK